MMEKAKLVRKTLGTGLILTALFGILTYGVQSQEGKASRKTSSNAAITGAKALPVQSKLTMEDSLAIDNLSQILHSGGEDTRYDAVIKLATFKGAQVVTALAEALKDPSPIIRYQAARVLGEQTNIEALDALVSALEDSDDRVRFHAARSLGKLNGRTAIKPLLPLLSDAEFKVRYAAAASLAGLLQRDDIFALDALVPALREDAPGLRLQLIDAVGKIGDPGAIPALQQLIETKNTPQTMAALSALAQIGGDQANLLLRDIEDRHPDATVRLQANKFLANPSAGYHMQTNR